MSLFIVAVGVLELAFHFPIPRWFRQLTLTVANFILAGLLLPEGQNWAGLACFILLTYAFLLLVRVWPASGLTPVLILATLAAFLLLKGHFRPELIDLVRRLESVGILPLISLRPEPMEVVGLSYMLFKFIDALVNQSEGTLEPFDFLSYVNYQLAFFTLLAGPIQRYNQFYRCWVNLDQGPGDERETLSAWCRLLFGILKMGAVAPLLQEFFLIQNVGAVQPDMPEKFVAQFYVYPIYLYVNFSGYTDLAIGCGRLLGFSLPENFDRPFAARNLLEFWGRWHMSLTHWVRDLIFMPFYKRAAEAAPRFARPAGYALLCGSMCVIGIWHGIQVHYVVFGLLHGVGVVVNQAWADGLRASLNRPALVSYQQSRLIRAAAWALTSHFVCFTFLFFALSFPDAIRLLTLFGAYVPLLTVLGFGAACLLPGREILIGWVERAPWRRAAPGLASLYAAACLQAMLVAGLLFVLWAFHHRDPEVVYQRF